jgi:hypothetical protein
MFRCERCKRGYGPVIAANVEYCPRCLGRDGVKARLSFTAFPSRLTQDIRRSTKKSRLS